MLSKCVNIACSARFLYLHAGKLFRLETSYRPRAAWQPSNRRAEHFWLCERCAQVLTVVKEKGIVTTRPRRPLLTAGEPEVEEVAMVT
jgi:hypothetical protein